MTQKTIDKRTYVYKKDIPKSENFLKTHKRKVSICCVCGEEFYPRQHVNGKMIGNFYRKTCSVECEKIYRKESGNNKWDESRKLHMKTVMMSRDTSSWKTRKGEERDDFRGGANTRYYSKLAFQTYNMSKVCDMCGDEKNLCVHHIDENRENNTRENLMILCKPCHTKYHSINNKLWEKHLKINGDPEDA